MAMLDYFCPTCRKWISRSGFYEIGDQDYQEQFCRNCNQEVLHEDDWRTGPVKPKFYEVAADVTQLRQMCDRVRYFPMQLNLLDLLD